MGLVRTAIQNRDTAALDCNFIFHSRFSGNASVTACLMFNLRSPTEALQTNLRQHALRET